MILEKLLPNASIDRIVRVINGLTNGGTNTLGTITLTNNGTTTTLQNNAIRATSVLFFSPQTANAASVTGLYYDLTSIPVTGSLLGGQITLHHSAVAASDLTFGYEVRN